MSKPIVLQEDFSGGAMQDRARYNLPRGKVWQVTNMIPNQEGSGLTRRSGWVRSYSAMSATSTSYAAGVGFAPFSGGSSLLGFDEDGRLYKWDPGNPSVTNVGAGRLPAHPPVFYRDLSIIPSYDGVLTPFSYDGTTLGALAGTPPTGSVAAIYKDHLVLARSNALRNRVWFSSTGSPTTWDTAVDGQWLDCSRPITGLATIRNMLLVFQEGFTERIRGDIIPGVVGSDFVREPLLQVGCADPASIAVSNDFVIFANGAGIFLTDGIGGVDLTKQCGMSQYWSSSLAGYDSNWTIAGAIWKDWYIFSAINSSVLAICGMIYLPSRTWVTLTNVAASMLASTPVGASNIGSEWLWMSERLSKNVSNLGAIIDRGGLSEDGDGTDIPASVETPYYRGDPGKKRWKNVYVGGNGTTVAVSITDTPIDNTYTSVGTLTLNADTRKRIPVGRATDGIGLKLEFTAVASNSTADLHSIEADAWALEPGRL